MTTEEALRKAALADGWKDPYFVKEAHPKIDTFAYHGDLYRMVGTANIYNADYKLIYYDIPTIYEKKEREIK